MVEESLCLWLADEYGAWTEDHVTYDVGISSLFFVHSVLTFKLPVQVYNDGYKGRYTDKTLKYEGSRYLRIHNKEMLAIVRALEEW